eukprot:CAMPEP_0114556750 /NCGR_PEP_ID=MMETSP0114-20121206/9454_1 /TAXON_ID=31324 /ORGANISM="Goniomonas sp, Strain m" /LENGTH=353 /DNA_ID=CAMNT_0001741973 /DNA_START=17 /DNA_END=1074 /DNA_ORIENTATION=+
MPSAFALVFLALLGVSSGIDWWDIDYGYVGKVSYYANEWQITEGSEVLFVTMRIRWALTDGVKKLGFKSVARLEQTVRIVETLQVNEFSTPKAIQSNIEYDDDFTRIHYLMDPPASPNRTVEVFLRYTIADALCGTKNEAALYAPWVDKWSVEVAYTNLTITFKPRNATHRVVPTPVPRGCAGDTDGVWDESRFILTQEGLVNGGFCGSWGVPFVSKDLSPCGTCGPWRNNLINRKHFEIIFGVFGAVYLLVAAFIALWVKRRSPKVICVILAIIVPFVAVSTGVALGVTISGNRDVWLHKEVLPLTIIMFATGGISLLLMCVAGDKHPGRSVLFDGLGDGGEDHAGGGGCGG